jgi:hypothetical protein
MRGVRMGLDRQVLFFKKKKSAILKENIEKYIKENELNHCLNVDIAEGYETPEELINKDGILVLISPYIKNQIDLTSIPKDKYYVLSEDEFITGKVEKIVDLIKALLSI